jgi:trk system potassium uptake protein TrkH
VKQRSILKLLAFFIFLFALSMTAPLVIAAVCGEAAMVKGFGLTLAAVVILALPVLLVTRGQGVDFNSSDGFLLVFLAWVSACLLGAFPFYLSGEIPKITDAVFESTSGFTTTGASLIADIEAMPRSLVFWRAETLWLGGMGMVVLTVALLPLLGVGGFQLVKAEIPGPDTERITPKITETAKLLWIMYIIITFVVAILLLAAGMDIFDAVIHAFSTVATGGFSSRNQGIAYYHSPAIEWIITVFMLIAGLNFTLLYRFFQRKFKEIINNSEARAYLLIIIVAVLIAGISLSLSAGTETAANIRSACFHVASILSTTGFYSENLNLWPALAQTVLFMLMFIGGCSGSTAGGFKVIRHVVLFKQAGNELRKMIYPRGVFSIRLNNKVGRKDVVYGVSAFAFLYAAVIGFGTLVVASAGIDLSSSFITALASVGNIGFGMGTPLVVAAFPSYVKWFLSFVMIAGRLELWTAFVFFSRDYWR